MSDEENNMEVDVEQPNPLNNMIDFVQNAEFNKAGNIFSDLIGQKVSDALEQEKIGMAASMWGQEEIDDEIPQEGDDDITDEELEALAASELETDDDGNPVEYEFDDVDASDDDAEEISGS